MRKVPFDVDARLVFAIADQWARESGSAELWPEDIMLVLLRRPTGGAAKIFTSLALDLPRIAAAVADLLSVNRGPAQAGKLPKSEATKRLLDAAVAEAITCGAPEAGTVHVLLGILAGGDRAACTVQEFGLDLKLVRQCASKLDCTWESASAAADPASRQAEERFRIAAFDDHLRRWVYSERVRGLVAAVRRRGDLRIAAGDLNPALEAWLNWATARADQLDPSNEILQACIVHLPVPP